MKTSLRGIRNRLLSFFSKDRLDRELDEELASHVEFATEENIVLGVTRDEARRQAIVAAAESITGVKSVEDHMDHPRTMDPLDRPNWPSPGRP